MSNFAPQKKLDDFSRPTISHMVWKDPSRNQSGQIRWNTATGELIPTAAELLEIERQRVNEAEKSAERERQRANEAEKSAELERQRADRLTAQLRVLGIDPDAG